MKNAIILVFCLFATSVAVFGQTRDCVAPNAFWLRPSDQYVQMYYELANTLEGRVIHLPELGEGMTIYTARIHPAQDWWGSPKRQNVAQLDKNEIWLCPFDKNYPYSYVSYWYMLYEQDPNNLLLDDLFGKILYIKTENAVWYLINLFNGTDTIAWSGLIRADVHWSCVENDLYPCTCTDTN